MAKSNGRDTLLRPETGPIDREMFFFYLEIWHSGDRKCLILITDKDGRKRGTFTCEVGRSDGAMLLASFQCVDFPLVLDFSGAESFTYSDYNDAAANGQMREYFEAGYSAWLQARLRTGTTVNLLLKT